MRILVVGGGGREHALAWKIDQSPKVKKIYCAPGNAGIAQIAECINIKAEDVGALKELALKNKIDLTVVGPEAPLVTGIVDEFEMNGLKVFGPKMQAAQLEGSKVFAKEMMGKYKVPTAAYEVFNDERKAIKYIQEKGAPLVIKADGLAAGKGVIVATDEEEAEEAIHRMMVKKVFGVAGHRVIIEECLEGEEASILAFTDGKTVIPMVSSQDHKRVFDGDRGPNTGGMGAYSPAPVVTAEVMRKIEKRILHPLISGMGKEGEPYKGVLYVGLMIKDGEPKVLEFNVRFGDPETQVVLPRMKTDLVEVMEAVVNGQLNKVKIDWDKRAAVCVVLASGGYPDSYPKGFPVSGLEEASKLEDTIVFHAGTKKGNGKVITSGGRVLGVTALGETIAETIDKAYRTVHMINFEKMHYRKDIGQKALKR